MRKTNIDCVVIADQEMDYANERLIGQLGNIIFIDEMGSYPLGVFDDGTKAIWYTVESDHYTAKEVIQMLLHRLQFICIRFEDSPFILTRNMGDMIDVTEDYYRHVDIRSLEKDLLTPAERYSLACIDPQNNIPAVDANFLYADSLDDDYVLIPFTPHAPELFNTEDVIVLTDDKTAETCEIELPELIPQKYFRIAALKLENEYQKIL